MELKVVEVPQDNVAGLIVADVGGCERELRIVLVVRDVGLAPAHEVVDHPHPEALVEQKIDHVAADEAGTAGDDRGLLRGAHCAPSFFMVRTL